MKYTFHILDVFSSTPFGGNQLAVLPDAAGISTEGMQKIASLDHFAFLGEDAELALPLVQIKSDIVHGWTPRRAALTA